MIHCFINGFIKIQRGTFGNHLLFLDGSINTDFCLMILGNFHSYPYTGDFKRGVVSEECLDIASGVTADEFGDFKVTAVNDDLHSLSFLQSCLFEERFPTALKLSETLSEANVPHIWKKCKFCQGLFQIFIFAKKLAFLLCCTYITFLYDF
jgi:hypothetical protein